MTNPNNQVMSLGDDEMEFRDQIDDNPNLFSGRKSKSFDLSSEFKSLDPIEVGRVFETRIG